MYEIVKAQFEDGKTLTKNRHYSLVRRDKWPSYHWDLYPLTNEYFHELNPYFLFNLYSTELFRFSKTVTVRDGYLNFAVFVVKNFQKLATLGPHYLIHPDLVPLVPPNLRSHFSVWKLSQPRKLELREAKTVLLYGMPLVLHMGPLEELRKRLEVLRSLREGTAVQVFLPVRKQTFKAQEKETVFPFELVSLLKDLLPGRALEFINTETLVSQNDFHSTVLFDLTANRAVISDDYVHYHVASKGGSVHHFLKAAPADSYFDLSLSVNHRLHVCPLPAAESIFVELLHYSRTNPGSDLLFDEVFQNLLGGKLNQKPEAP